MDMVVCDGISRQTRLYDSFLRKDRARFSSRSRGASIKNQLPSPPKSPRYYLGVSGVSLTKSLTEKRALEVRNESVNCRERPACAARICDGPRQTNIQSHPEQIGK